MEEHLLIKGLKQRNKVVFDFVFTWYYSGLCAYSFQIIHNRQAAEDLVQDFFVRLWHSAGELDITTSLKSYFFTSIRNRSLDYLKHEKTKQKYADTALPLPQGVSPDEIWEFTEPELRHLIEQALAQLPPRTREIFEMSRFKGLSNEIIANELGIAKRTVEVQISTALAQLRKSLKDYLPILFFL